MQTSEQLNEISAALAKAQGEIVGALKDSANPFFKSKYADLASCWDACRLPLSKNGLSVVQGMQVDAGSLYLITRLLHSSGQWISSTTPITPKDDTPQAMGSALTYARRYALTAMVGVAQVDDDANAASGRQGHDPRGDMGKDIPRDEAFKTAVTMRDILEADVDEDVKCLHVADRHDVLNKNPDLYVAAADQLKPAERKAWKEYLSIAKKREASEPRGRAA